jgi:MFS family permease
VGSSSIAGALLYIEPAFHLDDNPSLAGAIVSATLVGGVIATAFAGPSSDKFGRKRLLQVAATGMRAIFKCNNERLN